MAKIHKYKESHLDFVPSTQGRLALQRNFHVQYYMVKLTVVHDNVNAVFKDEALYNLINGYEIVVNGSDTIKQTKFKKLYLNNILGTSKRGPNTIVKTDGTDLVSTVWGIIPFSMPGMARPQDTILWTKPFTNFDLIVNWGSNETIGTGITVKSARLDVYADTLTGYKRNENESIKFLKETSLIEPIEGTNSEKTISLAPGKEYKTISIVAEVEGIKNDNMIKNIILKSGETVHLNLDAEALKADNYMTYQPPAPGDLKGTYIINLTPRGRTTDLLDTIMKYNTLDLVLNVEKQAGGDNFVNVYSDWVEKTKLVEKHN